jgi:hypothetical protein
MFKTHGDSRRLSDLAFKMLIGTTVVTALLAIPHGIFEGWSYGGEHERGVSMMLMTFAGDTRFLFEQLMYLSALIFVAAKFFETRTTFAVTFDRVDAKKVSVRGPDGDNMVWIGQRYASELEAQTVAMTLENRLKENAV